MSRCPPRLAPLLAALPALLLAGCPLPQAVPSYPSTGKIAPPRIQADGATPTDAIIEVAPDCVLVPPDPAGPVFTLAASLVDENTLEEDEARWFVDYQPVAGARSTVQWGPYIVDAPPDGITTVRPLLQPFPFHPYSYDAPAAPAPGGLHVVELVVSNGFEPADGTGTRPNRTTKPNFETQVFRWVFHYSPGGTCAAP
jgi:hypothetical protein